MRNCVRVQFQKHFMYSIIVFNSVSFLFTVLEALCEPKSLNEIMNPNTFTKTSTIVYDLGCDLRYFNMITIQVKVLHHLACIEISLERNDASYVDPRKVYTVYFSHLIGESLTLRYF
jgi:hypothetical protein